ncbi:MAG: energy-coupling factor transporter transmembrane protein EcfT [Clostridiales bacterium]|nr:energy-coupling factor transporter transmembrane protein EcfT [Clostridiales bacterium]
MFIYRYDDLFFQNIHPLALLSYMFTLFLVVIVSNHPILLCATALVIISSAFSVDGYEDIKKGLGFMLRLILLFMLINFLINKNGRTILWQSPLIPIIGRIQISLESIVYTLVMGIRLSSIYILFIFYNKAMNPDALLSYLAIVFPHSALLMSITTKTIPYLAQLSKRTEHVMYVMGLDTKNKGFIERLKSRIPILKIIFMSSIEDSLSIAESIQARGYGSGRRSRYFQNEWRVKDVLVLAGSFYAIGVFFLLLISGGALYNFYPRLDRIGDAMEHLGILLSLIIALLIPAAMGLGWKHWKYLKYKA